MSNPVRSVVWILLLPLVSLAGCFGGTSHVQRPETRQRAETALSRGLRAEQKGDSFEAEQLLTSSLELSTSIEDNPARVAALINLARTYRLRHDLRKAEESIDQAIVISESVPGLSSETAYEKALVLLAGEDADAALEWARKAIAAEQGNSLGSRLNLAGRIHLVRGEWGDAQRYALTALSENRSSGQAEEEANSLRILGLVARHEKRFDPATQLLQEALQIDKRIGKSAKIAADLEELAGTARNAGWLKESAGWLERAYEVHRAAGRAGQAADCQKALEALYTAAGETSQAQRAAEKARRLSVPAPIQQPGSSSTTTKPSSKP